MEWIYSTEDERWSDNGNMPEAGGDELVLCDKKGVIEGFGGCFNELGMRAIEKLNPDDRKKVLDELFDEDKCNFNYCRISMGANDFAAKWYSYNETEDDFDMENFSIERDGKYVLPYIKEAKDRNGNIKFFASPWSPPTWMKFPSAYNYGKLIWEEKYLRAYAKYIRLFIEAYGKENIKIGAYHIQNEPVADQKFPSCLWSGDEYREFIENYLIDEFESNGIDTEIWLGTLNHDIYNDYANIVFESEKCRKYVKGVGYQWMGKFAVQQTKDAFPDLKIVQTESECGDGKNTWDYAMYIFSLLRHYLRNGAEAYVYWNMALEDGGESTWGWHQNSLVTEKDGKAIFNPEFYVMKHFSHYIKRGARVIETTGYWSPNSIVVENPDGGVVAIVMNALNKAKTLTVGGKNYELKPRSFNTIVIK